jgi:type IV pilus assembly protein PilB
MIGQEKKPIGEILVEAGLINEDQLKQILKTKPLDRKFGDYVVELGYVDEKHAAQALEYQLKIPFINFGDTAIDLEAVQLISESLARKYGVIPIRKEGNVVSLAMTDPLDLYALDDVKASTGCEVKPLIATRSDVRNAIERYYGSESAEKAAEEFKQQFDMLQIEEINEDQSAEVANSPVVRLVNSIIQHAKRVKASDIHIEPSERFFRVRFRVDGELQEIMKSVKTAHSAVVTRIKIMGKMDIAEKRVPQDGRVETVIEGSPIDLRISVLPTVYGEKVTIRLLGRSDIQMSRAQLGFSDENSELFDKIIKSPNGIVLITGPTGSGKTTTLYAVLKELNKIATNIVTVEDPVEYRLEGINQVQVNNKAGLTFASGLRSILRQDPDIIMIGEIRDTETAQIAVRAAITGHLVLATMHTNDAASTVSRLLDMGVESYLVSTSLAGVVAQRLIRKICTNCRTARKATRAEMQMLKVLTEETIYYGAGCSYCNNTGYRGRTAIHEVLPVNSSIRELIERRASVDHIRSIAQKTGTLSLRDSCIKLVLDGTTTIDELVKVTYTIE